MPTRSLKLAIQALRPLRSRSAPVWQIRTDRGRWGASVPTLSLSSKAQTATGLCEGPAISGLPPELGGVPELSRDNKMDGFWREKNGIAPTLTRLVRIGDCTDPLNERRSAGMANFDDPLRWEDEESYWRTNWRTRPYASSGSSNYDYYQPGYRYGFDAAGRYRDKNW